MFDGRDQRMAHFGLICPELSGHLNPMTTLGRELKRRGHRVTLIGRPDAQRKTETAGLEFAVVGEKEFPPGFAGSDHGKARTFGRIECDSIYSRVAAARRSHSLGSGAGRD